MDDIFDGWPEYEVRTLNNFAPNTCDTCSSLTIRFYWCHDDTLDSKPVTWHTMCITCEGIRDQSLKDLYV